MTDNNTSTNNCIISINHNDRNRWLGEFFFEEDENYTRNDVCKPALHTLQSNDSKSYNYCTLTEDNNSTKETTTTTNTTKTSMSSKMTDFCDSHYNDEALVADDACEEELLHEFFDEEDCLNHSTTLATLPTGEGETSFMDSFRNVDSEQSMWDDIFVASHSEQHLAPSQKQLYHHQPHTQSNNDATMHLTNSDKRLNSIKDNFSDHRIEYDHGSGVAVSSSAGSLQLSLTASAPVTGPGGTNYEEQQQTRIILSNQVTSADSGFGDFPPGNQAQWQKDTTLPSQTPTDQNQYLLSNSMLLNGQQQLQNQIQLFLQTNAMNTNITLQQNQVKQYLYNNGHLLAQTVNSNTNCSTLNSTNDNIEVSLTSLDANKTALGNVMQQQQVQQQQVQQQQLQQQHELQFNFLSATSTSLSNLNTNSNNNGCSSDVIHNEEYRTRENIIELSKNFWKCQKRSDGSQSKNGTVTGSLDKSKEKYNGTSPMENFEGALSNTCALTPTNYTEHASGVYPSTYPSFLQSQQVLSPPSIISSSMCYILSGSKNTTVLKPAETNSSFIQGEVEHKNTQVVSLKALQPSSVSTLTPTSTQATLESLNINTFAKEKIERELSTTDKKIDSISVPSKSCNAPLPPLKSLSAYNFFFRDEREKILSDISRARANNETTNHPTFISSIKVDRQNSSNTAALEKSSTTHDPLSAPCGDVADTACDKGIRDFSLDHRDRLLMDYWNQDRGMRRRHRKTHGKISFVSLSQIISQRWKNISPDKKKFYHDVAVRDLERFQREFTEYQRKVQCHLTSEIIIKPKNKAKINKILSKNDQTNNDNQSKNCSSSRGMNKISGNGISSNSSSDNSCKT